MARPAYIIDGYHYHRYTGITDFQTILTDLETRLIADGWTLISSSAGNLVVESPVVDSIRFFRLTFSLTSATVMNVTLRDRVLRSTTTGSRRIHGSAGGHNFQLYYSARYFWLVNETATGGDDFCYASLLSLSPESETAHNMDTVFLMGRNSAGSAGSNCLTRTCEIVVAGAYVAASTLETRYLLPTTRGLSTSGMLFTHVSGARRWYSMWNFYDTGLRGRVYNALFGWGLTEGGEYQVPIDESTLGTFKVVPIQSGTDGTQIAVRIA